jgi:D-alanyl-D-alanine carboxypeptidase (penicillin-binding protein 5/6)
MKKLIVKCLQVFLLSLVYCWIFIFAAQAAPWTSSQYYCLMEGDTGQVLLSKNQDQMRPVASTTKIMTAVIALEYSRLDDHAVVTDNADHTPEYTIGLREGQTLTVAELIKIALIRSANDAAVVLAEHAAGDERFFAHLMSKKAFALGAVNTHFENASGLPSNNGYSTAYDMALISRYALANDYIAEMVSTARTTFKHPGYKQPLTITNTNGLLQGFQGADGIKTGTTNAAGRCLAASATREGRQLIAIVLRSGNRQGDCARLLEYGFSNYTKMKIIDEKIPFKTLTVSGKNRRNFDLYPIRPIYIWYDGEHPNIEKKVILNYEIKLPVKKGESLGCIRIYVDGKFIDSIDLISHQTIKESFWHRLLNE